MHLASDVIQYILPTVYLQVAVVHHVTAPLMSELLTGWCSLILTCRPGGYYTVHPETECKLNLIIYSLPRSALMNRRSYTVYVHQI